MKNTIGDTRPWDEVIGISTRGKEWVSALIMITWAITLALPGDTLSTPAFAAFHRFDLTETFWGVAFGMIGGIRITALVINGRWPTGPWFRVMGAVFGVITWSQVSYMLYLTSVTAGVAATGVGTYGVLALADLWSVRRAMVDARYKH
jgi:hypothetical protein